MFLVLSCSCLCTIYQRHVLSWEWRCSWSTTDRRSSNYIGVIFVYLSASYIRDLMVYHDFTNKNQSLGPTSQMTSQTIFLCKLKFDGNFILFSSKLQWNGCYKILHMSWQLSCRGMWKFSYQYDTVRWSYTKKNFHRIWITIEKLITKWAPDPCPTTIIAMG